MAILYDQNNNPGANSTVSQEFPDNPTFNSFAADDFVVPAGQTWSVTEVDATGQYFNGSGPADNFNVFFYQNNGGLPGAPFYSATAQSYVNSAGLFQVTLNSPAVLPPGTYWVSVQAHMSFTPGGEWGWTDRTVQSNQGAAWQNPSGGFGIPCTTWGRRGASTGCNIDPGVPDQMFRLIGTVSAGLGCPNFNAIPSMGSTIVPGTVDTGNHCDDCTTPVTFPFPVTLYGTSFTSALVSSNGNIQFTGNSVAFDTSCPLPDTRFGTAILAYQDDLATNQTGNGIFTSTSGTAPNRIFNVEWRASYFGRTGTANFEVQFFESTGDFAVIYGTTADNGMLEETGVQEGPTGRATAFSCREANLPAGLKVAYRCPGVSCNDYTVTSSKRPLVAGTTDVGNHCDDCITAVTLPFAVSLYGASFTTGNVSSNGNFQFVSSSTAFTNTDLPAVGFGPTIFPFWDDLLTNATGNGVFSSVSGTAPNRTYALEYRATSFTGAANTTDFQILFNEGSTTFEVLYGATAGTGFTGTIGVQQAATGLATRVAGPNAVVPAANTRYIFSLGCCPPIAFTGALGANSSSYRGVSGMQTGRLFRDGIRSACGTQKPTPALNDSITRAYDAYTFLNNGPATCVTFSVNTACSGANFVFPVAYLGSFNPANITQNYLGDPGLSPNPYETFSVNVPANATVVLVVSELTAGAGCPGYDVVASGFNCQPLALTSAVSRKTHGGVGAFDVNLPLTGTPGVESRTGGTGGNHTIIFTFNDTLTSATGSVTAGPGSIAAPLVIAGNQVTVNLANVTNAQTVSVTLSNVKNQRGETLANTTVSVGFLLGDTNGDRSVNGGDAIQTRSRSGQPTDATNFRSDVNVDGVVNGGDSLLVRGNSGAFLP